MFSRDKRAPPAGFFLFPAPVRVNPAAGFARGSYNEIEFQERICKIAFNPAGFIE